MASGLRIIEQLKVERLSTNKPATKYSERLFRCESGREAHQHPRTSTHAPDKPILFDTQSHLSTGAGKKSG